MLLLLDAAGLGPAANGVAIERVGLVVGPDGWLQVRIQNSLISKQQVINIVSLLDIFLALFIVLNPLLQINRHALRADLGALNRSVNGVPQHIRSLIR